MPDKDNDKEKELAAQRADEVLKKYDKDSNTMVYTGIMGKIRP